MKLRGDYDVDAVVLRTITNTQLVPIPTSRAWVETMRLTTTHQDAPDLASIVLRHLFGFQGLRPFRYSGFFVSFVVFALERKGKTPVRAYTKPQVHCPLCAPLQSRLPSPLGCRHQKLVGAARHCATVPTAGMQCGNRNSALTKLAIICYLHPSPPPTSSPLLGTCCRQMVPKPPRTTLATGR